MTFELSSQHVAVRDEARTLAHSLQADDIDRSGSVPADVATQLSALGAPDLLALVIAVAEVATVSAAAALAGGSADGARALSLTGLRGAREVSRSSQGQLVLAAAALGVGTAALDASIHELRTAKASADAAAEKPHWVVADVATEIDAARLMTYKAARTQNEADVALARLMATSAANRAVDAAIRVVGASALAGGSVIERLARDVRALSVLGANEDAQRAVAAEGLLPQ
jgi:hypothetical protein